MTSSAASLRIISLMSILNLRFMRFRSGTRAVNQAAPALAPFGDSLHGDDPAVDGNAIGAGKLVVTRTAGASAIQSQPLEQVGHACGRSGSGDIAGCGASSLDSLATRLSGNAECVVSQRSEEHTSELQSRGHLVCRLLL